MKIHLPWVPNSIVLQKEWRAGGAAAGPIISLYLEAQFPESNAAKLLTKFGTYQYDAHKDHPDHNWSLAYMFQMSVNRYVTE